MTKTLNSLFNRPEPKSGLQRYRLLSKNCALRVSPLCLGGMNFGNNWADWMGLCDKATTFAILDEYYRLGGNFIDTAVNYQGGQSEEWIGEWIRERKIPREDVCSCSLSTHAARGCRLTPVDRSHMVNEATIVKHYIARNSDEVFNPSKTGVANLGGNSKKCVMRLIHLQRRPLRGQIKRNMRLKHSQKVSCLEMSLK
ncbi:Aldo/keto reductase [Gonapodya prolifera JEL478]|uniref:Aldo/keto reductase n=1 Tax=Gonapodya prolifera (strain JEL478) TaxID=1344416 RepID=A0A139A640_GONPJ|nr:Aldo/keto reductase [Gonapodya prolifera JEL478]|eukprot:KXS12119.1 Aldo/keto reductase [Gonapodya prolifera JEL478]